MSERDQTKETMAQTLTRLALGGFMTFAPETPFKLIRFGKF